MGWMFLPIAIIGMICGSILLIVAMGLRFAAREQELKAGPAVAGRVEALERELAQLRELVQDALIEQDDPHAVRLARQIDQSSVDA